MDVLGVDYTYYLNFISNNKTFTYIHIYYMHGYDLPPPHPSIPQQSLLHYSSSSDWLSWEAYDDSVTIDEAYRTITITGGTDVANTNLINWLYENATLVSR